MLLLDRLLLLIALTVRIHAGQGESIIGLGNVVITISDPPECLKSIKVTGKELPYELNLSRFGFKRIDEGVFVNFSYVNSLNLANNSLTQLSPSVLGHLKNLKYLNLANNYLETGNFYTNLSSLVMLNISNNPITHFHEGHFFGLTKFIHIITIGIQIKSITSDMFLQPSNDIVYKVSTDTRRNVYIQSPTNNFNESDDLWIKVCIQYGLVESLEDFDHNESVGGCRIVRTFSRILHLDEMGINTFKAGWYRVENHSKFSLNLENNVIRIFSRELLNDLPPKINNVSLRGNHIRRLDRGVIENNNPIIILNLQNNKISEIAYGAFEKINLTGSLYLDGNQLTNTEFLSSLPLGIREVSLSNNSISKISEGNFKHLTNFTFLNLDGNKIRTIQGRVLHGLWSLRRFHLADNGLISIDPEFLQDLPNLQYFSLKNNSIKRFDMNFFSGVEDLRFLYLNSNQFRTLDKFPKLPPHLQSLNMKNNQIIRLKTGTFVDVPSLTLDLSQNSISKIEKQSIDIPSLHFLNLRDNELEIIYYDMFNRLIELTVLRLDNNKIKAIETGAFSRLKHLRHLSLSGNPIRILPNGGLYGIKMTHKTYIYLEKVPVEMIQGGLFHFF